MCFLALPCEFPDCCGEDAEKSWTLFPLFNMVTSFITFVQNVFEL